jgi:hypothetical protein
MTLAVREDISCCEERGRDKNDRDFEKWIPQQKKSVLSLEWLTAYIYLKVQEINISKQSRFSLFLKFLSL